jgi:hypothetical protein
MSRDEYVTAVDSLRSLRTSAPRIPSLETGLSRIGICQSLAAVFPDDLGGLINLLPSMRTGEGLFVGEAMFVPSRVHYVLRKLPKVVPIRKQQNFGTRTRALIRTCMAMRCKTGARKLRVEEMEMIYVDSQSVDLIGYDEETSESRVIFKTSGHYVYSDVSHEVWERFRDSQSKGTFVKEQFKVKGYPCRKI